MIQSERIKPLNALPVRPGKWVVYWMQQSQRSTGNHALEYSIEQANALRLPLIVCFCLDTQFPEANWRHYHFMLAGLRVTAQKLEKRGILLTIRKGSPQIEIPAIAKQAALVVVDKGYLRIQKQWRSQVAAALTCPLIEVESDIIVPVETALDHEAYAAGILRPRIQRLLFAFLVPLAEHKLNHSSLALEFPSADLNNLTINRSVEPVTWIEPGEVAALKILKNFIATRLDRYAELGNDPAGDHLSRLSPYLHFGQISVLQVALSVLNSASPAKDAFLEQLIVRRELAINFVFFNTHYDAYDCLPTWARNTLALHRRDKRPYLYTTEQLESAQTHDPYWNAAQREMVLLGKMHGYMRMYWAKKIIEWTASPEAAYACLLYLNNKYFIDGRDPNGFAGIAWSFGKHDRAWAERPVFGKVRYMNDKGLMRKYDIEAYVRRIEKIDSPS